jgi:spore coat protein U-like protein
MTSMRLALAISSAAVLGLANSGARALTATSSFSVTITITATCTIVSTSTLAFPTQTFMAGNVDQTTTLQVQCTNTTPYNIGLDAGTGSGATVTTRKMTSGANTINYSLYSDSGHSTVWGNTVGTNTVAATGNGSPISYTIYGRVPQQTPVPGSYADTITVTVTY